MSLDFEDIISILPNSLSRLSSDNDLGNKLQREIGKRDRFYTDLLRNYVQISKVRNGLKEFHKWFFFWLIVISGAFCIFYIVHLLNKILEKDDITLITNSIPVIVTSIVSLISTVIVIPITITNFLFNTKEDDNITTVIQHTQEHDTSGINLLKERFIEKAVKDAISPRTDNGIAGSDIN